MPATYDRRSAQWDEATLNQLVADGKATYFEGPDVYVVKRPEGGQVAVRSDQILRSGDRERLAHEATFAQAMDDMAVARQRREEGIAKARQLHPAGSARPVSEHRAFSSEADALIAQFTKKG